MLMLSDSRSPSARPVSQYWRVQQSCRLAASSSGIRLALVQDSERGSRFLHRSQRHVGGKTAFQRNLLLRRRIWTPTQHSSGPIGHRCPVKRRERARDFLSLRGAGRDTETDRAATNQDRRRVS